MKISEINDRILTQMEKLSKKNNAPVYEVERETKKAFEILIFTLLSSRTKDETTLKALDKLRKNGLTNPKKLEKANPIDLERLLYGVGFYKTKAKHIIKVAKIVNEKGFPKSIEEITKLPGVGIKTGSIVLARVFKLPYLGVDTHVHRIANRIGLVNTKKPKNTSEILNQKLKERYKIKLNRIFVAYGQTICKPKDPKCKKCVIKNECNYFLEKNSKNK